MRAWAHDLQHRDSSAFCVVLDRCDGGECLRGKVHRDAAAHRARAPI